ncbi:Asp/Glu racemase [uncultured Tateyamaria sp.]|uniref:maleate cis-trans isomerase family protein n=1 Tax=uncultured Tateyamaria sp. TaxID=455651 RepID=UPI00260F870A|nr:Asp/Glu racemase [uncultured Tateyamaria sp.]
MTDTRGRARIGVLVPFTNSNLEPDFAMMRPAGVSIHVARMGGYDEDAVPDEHQMHDLGAADLDDPLHLLSGIKPDVVVYGCTSATLTHGPAFDRALAGRIAASSGAKTVTAAGALVHALKALGVTRIGFASPYVAEINDMAIRFLADTGFDTVARGEVGAALGNHEQGALDPDAVMELGMRADHPQAEAIVLSCTEMRSLETLQRLEDSLGKPVISSNQAMMFETLGALGIGDPISGFGQLLERVTR